MPNRSALLIGVSEYGEGFEPLPGSLLDVRQMDPILADTDCGGFQVKSLENPDRTQMETAIEEFFRGRQAGDSLLLYFSGHGDLGSGGMLNQHLHFCGRTSQKQDRRLVESSAMPAEFLKRQMGFSKADQIVVILDCCYSGAIADLLKKGEGDIDFSELRASGRVILASSSAAKTSLQEVDGLSLYTRYLIEGMAGAAYQGQGKWIVARDLHNYADRRFEIENKGYQPKIIVTEDKGFDLPVVKAPKPDAKLSYHNAVDELFRELDAELGLEFDGEISDALDLGSLDTLRDRLNLADADAQTIEQQVQKPYLVRAKQRQTYTYYFEQAVQLGKPLSDRQRRRLEEIRQNIGLGHEDVQAIELAVIQRSDDFRSAINFDSPIEAAHSTCAFEFEFATVAVPSTCTFEFEFATVAVPSLEITKESGMAEYFREDLGNGVTIDMVRIPTTELWMGKFQVTQAQWKAIAQLPQINQELNSDPACFKRGNLPVERVSWVDAIEACDRLTQKTGNTYRLPSEAEWEYACRAGTTTAFHFGETIFADLANYDGNYVYEQGVKGVFREKTTAVGSFPPNAFGLFDMHGNVWEWCADLWSDTPQDSSIDGSPQSDRNLDPKAKRLLRGGSWYDQPDSCPSACRYRSYAVIRNKFFGCRFVCHRRPPRTLS